MASCQTEQWVSTSPYVKLTVSEVSSSATQITLRYTLYYVASSAAKTSSIKYAYLSIGDWYNTYPLNINGIAGTYTITTGTRVIEKTKASKNIVCSVSFGFNLTWSDVYCGSKSASMTYSIAAKNSYKITYNANGGTGAPAAQTKWYDETLTLSSTKPTRAGHTFQGWGTSTTDTTADYQPGVSYITNEAITLYAIWKANTYTITYNANGGTGAPAAQTKTYGVNLTLATSKPTRTNYTFKGWSRTSNGAVAYNAGATYTANAAITLYAVWELSYLLPKIYNAKAEWLKGTNLLTDSAGPFVSGTDSNYGYQNLLSSACSRLGLFGGKVYTLTFDWAVNWGGKTPVTNVEVRVGYAEDHGDFEGVSASKTIPNLSTQTSGTFSFTFTHYTAQYSGSNAVPAMIQAIYCSSKDALDGTTWTISNVKLVEEDKISVAFDWETTNSNPTGNLGFYNADGSTAHTVSLGQLSGNSGHFEHTIAASEANSINIDTSYVVKITLSDGGGNTTSAVTLAGNAYSIDLLAGGKGISFGGAASLEDTAHFQWDVRFDKPVYGMVRGLGKLPKIEPGSDFNAYMNFGVWAVYGNADTLNINNMPSLFLYKSDDAADRWVGRAGILEVYSPTGEGMRSAEWSYIRQRFIPYSLSYPIMERDITRNASNVWNYGAWYKTSLSAKDKPVTLYSSGMGVSTVVNLTQSVTDFEYLEIFFTDNNGEKGGYTKIHRPTAFPVIVDLSIIEAAGTKTYIRRTSYTISGTTMTPDAENAGYALLSGTGLSHTSGTNYIKITRVVGHYS